MNFEDFCLNYNLSAIDRRIVKSYAEFFFAEKQERLERFIGKVVSDCNINRSELDLSENSLRVLNKWLVNHIECVKLSKEEYELVRKTVPDYIDIDDWRFSTDTFSNIIDVGLYLGEVMIHKYPSLKWEQCLKSKKSIDYGQMIIKLGKMEMNPMRLVNVICLEVINDSNSANCLIDLLEIWEKYVIS